MIVQEHLCCRCLLFGVKDQHFKAALDTTWTAQAIVSLIYDIELGLLDNNVVLYWHTFNSRPAPKSISEIGYHQLPEEFWDYFEAAQLAIIIEPDTS